MAVGGDGAFLLTIFLDQRLAGTVFIEPFLYLWMEACPVEKCLYFNKDYEFSAFSRDELVTHFGLGELAEVSVSVEVKPATAAAADAVIQGDPLSATNVNAAVKTGIPEMAPDGHGGKEPVKK